MAVNLDRPHLWKADIARSVDDSGYLGYEAAEGIDWVWEHRIDDLAPFGL